MDARDNAMDSKGAQQKVVLCIPSPCGVIYNLLKTASGKLRLRPCFKCKHRFQCPQIQVGVV